MGFTIYSLKNKFKNKMVFYAIANGITIGIFTNWNDCDASVKGYKNAIYKKFATQTEAKEFIEKYQPVVEAKEFISDYYVYTDGACSNNGKLNAIASIGIYFGPDDLRNTSKRIVGKQTNNTAELSAIIETYELIKEDVQFGKKISIVTDSEYAIKCVGIYGEKCFKTQWKKDIPNKELVQIVYELYKGKHNIQFIHIKSHTNNTDIHTLGNYHADQLANQI